MTEIDPVYKQDAPLLCNYSVETKIVVLRFGINAYPTGTVIIGRQLFSSV